MNIYLKWSEYKHFPYEKELARRELNSIFNTMSYVERDGEILLSTSSGLCVDVAKRLTYFSSYRSGQDLKLTTQRLLEQTGKISLSKQSTRYSVHGLHEYKGKFNPQVARVLLNIFGAREGTRVLDPFCGSGTTLVESAHLGSEAVGTDLNPLAVFVTNAKIVALSTPVEQLEFDLNSIVSAISMNKLSSLGPIQTARDKFMSSWFDDEHRRWVEYLIFVISDVAENRSEIFLSLLSNLLRDYSLQEPSDLRIRRRFSPMPTEPIAVAFEKAARKFLSSLSSTQKIIGVQPNRCTALLQDVRETASGKDIGLFDIAITSPPYATALPYIDTQRLSLVALGLCEPDEIRLLDGALIGSREATTKQKAMIVAEMRSNESSIPAREMSFCTSLVQDLGPNDGFRRQAVPSLLYRYFVAMQSSLSAVLRRMKPGAPYALIVGHNHTILSGRRRDIDTPSHIASLADHVGWHVEELVPLQTYQRFGLHSSNAVAAEALLILRAP